MKHPNWRVMVLALVLALAMVAVVACGGGGTSGDEGGSSGGDEGSSGDAGGDELQAVTIRIMADVPPPPFNISVAMERFLDQVEERLPGSRGQSYYAGALYPTESDTLEAMVAGNHEMIFGQFGKASGFEPRMNLVTQPMQYTTIGAMRHFPETETADYLRGVMEERGILTKGYAHLSFYLAVSAPERIRTLEDFAGKKTRSLDPIVGNTVLSAWGASPITMAFGEVPSALETGALDAVVTSIGGYMTIREQAPYYSVLGVGGVTTDLYYIGVSQQWWDSLNEPTRAVLEELIAEMTELSDQITYCDDLKAVEEFGTEDPEQEGIYFLTEEEKAPFREALGTKVADALKRELPEDAHQWADKFAEEGVALSQQYPEGSDSLEQTDCETLFAELGR